MLKVYNTLTRKKEPFIPVEEGKVKMYVCGMTTYSDAHIGHARTYVAFDIIRRYLEYKGYDVFYIQNITDIDDKIIKSANEAGMDALEYSSYYAKRCLDDMKNLGIKPANLYPKATEHIEDMIELVKELVNKKYAYVANGDVYFSVEKFSDYGKLSRQNMKQIKAGARVEVGEKKRRAEDFALWKSAKPGEPFWESPWGNGRPGWHIECSVMSSKYLGIPFDIHGGGQDLIFPHHENEIAQAESAYGKRFVNYWIHSGMLKVNGEKMSKSLGNIINIRDALKKWDAEAIRFFFASYHYRSPADFNENAIKNSENALKRIYITKEKLEEYAGDDERVLIEELNEKEREYLNEIENFCIKFESAMDDDFNTPKAIETLFDFIKKTNKFLMEEEKPNEKLCKYALNEFLKISNVLTLLQGKEKKMNVEAINKLAEKYGVKKEKAEKIIEKILEMRRKARNEKNYELADEIREDLRKAGIEIEDAGSETRWRIK
ncbi:MAG TPA: cysteine--tRNA ligase [Thermoplasmatales archaeon]|nr:cysteine--tRNA ligase [Thermoplasmatales archaeon]